MKNYTQAKGLIRSIQDYPKPGIIFRDITPLLEDFQAFSICIDELSSRVKELNFDKIACIDARGFITGIACAMKLSKSFFLLRKKGKLPYKTFAEDYELEYGNATMEIHQDSIAPNDRVLICDDLLATGGTAMAAYNLIKKAGGKTIGFTTLINLPDLKGSQLLEENGVKVYSLFEFEGE